MIDREALLRLARQPRVKRLSVNWKGAPPGFTVASRILEVLRERAAAHPNGSSARSLNGDLSRLYQWDGGGSTSLTVSLHDVEDGQARHAWRACKLEFLEGVDWMMKIPLNKLSRDGELCRWVPLTTVDAGRQRPSLDGCRQAMDIAEAKVAANEI